MTPNERKKILDWIEENQFKVSSHPPMADYILNADDLTAFIESLSTEEDTETLRNGDWTEVSSREQADKLHSIVESGVPEEWISAAVLCGAMVYYDSDLFNSDDKTERINKLTSEEFERRARNTFNNPKL